MKARRSLLDKSSKLPVFSPDMCAEDMDRMMENAQKASSFLKAISHEGRLMILCYLSSGEKSVTQMEEMLSARQAAVSQQLSRLRFEGLVKTRPRGENNLLQIGGMIDRHRSWKSFTIYSAGRSRSRQKYPPALGGDWQCLKHWETPTPSP